MITCDNCGAQYDDEADKCPYCGSDNFGKIVQEHEDIVNGLNREKEHLEQLPKNAAKKGRSLMTRLLIGLVVLVVIAVVYEAISAVATRKISYHSMQRHTKKLESMYQQEDYAGIYHYMKKKDLLYRNGYDKYSDIANMERYFEEYMDYMDEGYRSWIVKNGMWDSIYDVTYVIQVLSQCQLKEDERYKYGDEAAVAYYRQKSYEYLKEHYGITQEETDQLIEDAGGFLADDYERTRQIQENMQKLAYKKLKEAER